MTEPKYFDAAGIPSKIPYEGPSSKNPLAFRYYNAEEVILGKPMKDWLRFAICFWHTFRGVGVDMFGGPTISRPWEDGTDSIDNAIRRVRVAFDFFKRLGINYYTFHDRDVAPEGKNIEESNANLDQVTKVMKELQNETGIKLLWGTANLFSSARYMNGAATNPDLHVFTYAAAQVKKAIEVTHYLGGENYVLWGGREGYSSLLNINIKKEIDHYAAFLRLVRDYKHKIGFNGTLLIEPKPREPTKHQYDYDAQTVIGFLKTYGLDADFKLNIEPNHTTLAGHDYEHDIEIASRYGMLGSIDSNTGDTLLGWDTDCFLMDIKKATILAQIIVRQGGLGSGGLNFDCKVRRESVDIEDMFIAHIGGMDTFARGLRNFARLSQEKVLESLVEARYASWDSELGKKIEEGKSTLEELEEYAKKSGEPTLRSAKQEKFELLFNDYI